MGPMTVAAGTLGVGGLAAGLWLVRRRWRSQEGGLASTTASSDQERPINNNEVAPAQPAGPDWVTVKQLSTVPDVEVQALSLHEGSMPQNSKNMIHSPRMPSEGDPSPIVLNPSFPTKTPMLMPPASPPPTLITWTEPTAKLVWRNNARKVVRGNVNVQGYREMLGADVELPMLLLPAGHFLMGHFSMNQAAHRLKVFSMKCG
jgi:hypothetical protein